MNRRFRFRFLLAWLIFCSAAFGQAPDGQPVPPPPTTQESSGPAFQEAVTNASEEGIEPENEVSRFREVTLDKVGELLNVDLGGNSLARLGLSFLVLLMAFVARKLVVGVFLGWLQGLAQRTRWTFDDKLIPLMAGPASAMVFIIGFFLSLSVLSLSPGMDLAILRIFQASTVTIIFWGLLRAIDVLADLLAGVAKTRDMGLYHFVPLIKKTARVFLIVIAVVLVVQNLGYSVGSLLAGMGIGGLALALAAQESLANFFGSVSLVADRPFKVGDWIQIGDRIDGDVEEIGLRSTKVRTWAKSQLSIPNKVLANEIVENWSRMPKRRVKQVVGVTYGTSPETMEGLVEDIRRLLREDEGVEQSFILVNFTDFGASSLDILVYYFTISTKWLEHMDVRQRINLKIMRAVAERGSSIALPTRTLHFEGEIAERLAGKGT